MKKIFTFLLLLCITAAHSQLLTWSPDFIQETSNKVSITMDANYGNKALLNSSNTNGVYVHTGVITTKSTSPGDWQHVVTTWATSFGFEHAPSIGNNKYQFTIDTAGGLRGFYNVTDPNEHILKIAILFRSSDGNTVQRNADASDMYVPVYGSGEYVRIDNPYRQPTYTPVPETITKNVGDALPIVAKASLPNSTIQIYFTGALLSTVTGTKDSINTTIAASGAQTIIAKATSGGSTSSDTINFYVNPSNNIAAIPAGDVEGINYEAGDTSATLVLYAPLKKSIFVLGDFNNWAPSSNYLMNVTPDGNYFWIRLTGLTKGVQYAYQYLIDNSLQLADYNSQLVLDKNADPYIPANNFPGLEAYPSGAAGSLASVLQTGQTQYVWNDAAFVKPDKRNLLIYELLVRDFVSTQSWNTLADTLNYLKKLGVNAIEVLPFNNFEGASSWGYNSNFFFAPDKQYGTPAALKHFIDACHQNGMAVIMDLAMQDVSGSSPLVQMYYNPITNTPSSTNPWLDSLPTHPYGVGAQFNHTSPANITLRNRVYAYWIDSFHLDGYRFDLAGGYTQTQYSTDNGNTDFQTTYDQGRVNTWDSIYTKLQSIKPNTYCILESFVDSIEQKDYTDYGMLTWGNGGNESGAFEQSTMGYNTNWDFSGGIYSNTGLAQPGSVTYMESHDEERLQFKNEAYGDSSGAYKVKDLATGLHRDGAAAAFWAMMPGPKMMWQFGELGYDYSINYCIDNANNNCRTGPKPIRWDYLNDSNRLALHNVYAKLLALRNYAPYFSAFVAPKDSISSSLGGSFKWEKFNSAPLDIMVIGNFDVVPITGSITFSHTGVWYDYLNNTAFTIINTAQSYTLQPGEYHVFIDQNASAVLPVSLLSFTGNRSADAITLNWTTANEINLKQFVVERSFNGRNFTAIGTVQAGSRYNFTDADNAAVHASGNVFYRLKAADKDGSFAYSAIVIILPNGKTNIVIYPNPVKNGVVYLALNSNITGRIQINISDVSGRICSLQTVQANGSSKLPLTIGALANGVYNIKIIAQGSNPVMQQLVVQR